MKNRKSSVLCFVFMAAVVFLASSSMASDVKPSGTVSIESKTVALGVGIQWGNGVLKFNDKEYPFKVNGLSVIDIGISSVSATGVVYDLKKMEDFAGIFSAAEASIVLGGGVGAATMKNQNGVYMQLKSTKAGIQLKLAPEGLKVEMK
jgi:hypothetical protein